MRLLRHEGLPLALVHQGDGDVSLAAVDLILARRLGGHVTLLAGDMLAGQHQIHGAAGTTDGTDDGGWATLLSCLAAFAELGLLRWRAFQ